MTGRLIAIDLDGTLLDENGELSSRSIDAVADRVARGDRVVLATGRPPQVAIEPTIALTGLASHVIGANGTIIATFPADRGASPQVLHVGGFGHDDAARVVGALRTHDDRLGFGLATDHGFAHEHGFAELMPALVSSSPVDDVLELGGTTAYKLFVYHPVHDVDHLLVSLPPVVDRVVADFAVSHMGADAAEIGPVGHDKCSGLRWLCDHLGVERRDVIAIGDELNDLRMIEWAGHGVAMGNADPAVRSVADQTIGRHDADGVARFLEGLDVASPRRPPTRTVE